LVSQQVGRAHLVAISQDENRGKVMQVYTVEPELQADAFYDANALFVGRNDGVLYGSARGYLFVWDKASARILCGLDHGEGASPICNTETDGLTPWKDALCKPPGYVFGMPVKALRLSIFLDIPKKRRGRGKLCRHWKSRRNAELVGRTYEM
jgi:hypothetical protein